MKFKRQLEAGALMALALFIWLRNRSWMQGAADTLPVLCALPLYVWLAGKRVWCRQRDIACRNVVLLAVLVLLTGLLLDLTVLLAISWCLFLYIFLRINVVNFSSRLLLLPWLGFPWIATDAQWLGWWFRFTGAGAAELIFSVAGFHVEREGTLLVVQGLPLAVDVACSGLNVLQAMLIAGFVVIYIKMPSGRQFWLALLLLVPLAWLANTVRILTLGITALSLGPDFAMGWFHQWGGWLVLCLMFVLCEVIFSWLARMQGRGEGNPGS